MEVWAGNLAAALDLAITTRRQNERSRGYTSDSALVAGWEELLNAIVSCQVDVVTIKREEGGRTC